MVGALSMAVFNHDMDAQVLGDVAVDQVEEPPELLRPVPCRHIGDDLARGDVQRRVEVGGPVADVIVRAPFGDAGEQGQAQGAAVQGQIWDFSSTQNTTPASGGLRYSPTMSRTLSMNWGSGDSLGALCLMGLEPEGSPDAADRRLVQARRRRHRPHGPVRGVERLLLQRLDDNPLR
jgi:hypothetical protein